MSSSAASHEGSKGESQEDPMVIELHGDEFWPLSGKPFFRVIMTKASLRPPFQLIIPAKMHPHLPSCVVTTYLTYKGKKWKMVYHGNRGLLNRFNMGWKSFVEENNLKVGDGCVFELMECSKEKLIFRVQILRDEIPSELPCAMNVEEAGASIAAEQASSSAMAS